MGISTSQVEAPAELSVEDYFPHPPDRFVNRELSWLAFNTRILDEANNPDVPLLERLKFLSICASNLDEFYMVRIAGLKDQQRHGIVTPSFDGLSPTEQLERIEARAHQLIEGQQQCWRDLQAELAKEQIEVTTTDALSKAERTWLESYFQQDVFPLLTPIAIDPAHPFPFIANLGNACLFELYSAEEERHHTALVVLPHKLQRFVRLGKVGVSPRRFVSLESVVSQFGEQLFPGFTVTDFATFCIVRDSDLDVQEDAEDLVRYFEKAVKKRRRGRVVRATITSPVSEKLKHFIVEKLDIKPEEMIEVDALPGIASILELYDCNRPDLKYLPFDVRFPERINDFNGDCFAAIRAKDIVVHHPYESFDVVVRFLQQAAEDPDVVLIKQTLYRTSQDSPIVQALIEAAEAGKSVTALVELRARFDEEANIKWARDMERVGVQVVYGFVDLKTHAKLSLVVRRESGKLKSYAHFGTGNYHPMTAKVYTDLSYFTCNPQLCKDASLLFNFITGYAKPEQFTKIAAAPHGLRRQLLSLIHDEIEHAKAGRPASIWAKMNALIDPEIIDTLYIASQAGVQIELLVRGICGLRPGVPGFSDNIRVKSLVGRFLEHARVYCFGAGRPLPHPKAKLFIASADWMPRNFDYRVEVMVPIENRTVHAQILDQILVANLKDNLQSWEMDAEGHYHRLTPTGEPFRAHDYFINNPSLSGRGKALQSGGMPARIRAIPLKVTTKKS